MHPVLQANTPLGRVKEDYYLKETYTTRLVQAMQAVLATGTLK